MTYVAALDWQVLRRETASYITIQNDLTQGRYESQLTAYVLVLAILNSLRVGSMNGENGKWDGCLCDEDFGPLGGQSARQLIIFQARTTNHKRDRN